MGKVGQKTGWDSKTSTNLLSQNHVVFYKIMFLLKIRLRFLTFLPRIRVFSKKKKKGFYLYQSKILHFLSQNHGFRLKSPHFFSNFVPKQRCGHRAIVRWSYKA